MSYFLKNEEVNEEVEEVKAQDGIASIEPLLDNRIVRETVSDPGAGNSLFITGGGHHRAGSDRYGQDGCIRHSGDPAHQSGCEKVTDHYLMSYQRTGDPGGAGASQARQIHAWN